MPINNFPKWLACYGIVPESIEVDIQYKKNQMQLSAYSTPSTNVDQQRQICKDLKASFMEKVVSMSDDSNSVGEWILSKMIEDMDKNVVSQLYLLKDILTSAGSARDYIPSDRYELWRNDYAREDEL